MPYIDSNEGPIFLPSHPVYSACPHCQHPVDITHAALSHMADLAAQIAMHLHEGAETKHVISGIAAFHDYVTEMKQADSDNTPWARRLSKAIYDAQESSVAYEKMIATPRRRRRVST